MRLFLLFLIVPLIEIALFIQVGGAIGLPWTLLIVILTAILGTVLVRSQGMTVLGQLRGSMQDLQDPTEPLIHGAMVLFSGALLLTPGFFTDAVGFALLIPGVRGWLFQRMKNQVSIQPMRHGKPARDELDPNVVDAEYEDLSPPSSNQKPSGWTRH